MLSVALHLLDSTRLIPPLLNYAFACAASAAAPGGRVSSRSVLPAIDAENTAVDYAEQLLAPGMPPLDEIKDLKVRATCSE